MAAALRTRAFAALLATAVPSTASAVNFEVSGDIVGQGYEVASPWGDVVVGRRRLLTTLGLSAYNLQGEYEPFEADYSVVTRVRLDADFGADTAERSFDAADTSRYVPGYNHVPVDLMYGWVEGHNLGGGWFGFKVGRQYMSDVLGFWNFDGGLFRLVTPFFVQAEVYGGLEQRGGLLLSTSRFEGQGVWRGNRNDLKDANRTTDYPSYQEASEAPAFGAAIESNGPNWIHGRLDYRRVYNTGPAFTGQFPAADGGGLEEVDGLRLSSEKVGYALTAFLADLGAVRGGFAYDMYNQMMQRVYGGLDVYATNTVNIGVDYEYFIPTFDADSIFNWFAHNPSHTATGRVALGRWGGFDASVSGGVRMWLTDGSPDNWAAEQCAANNPDPIAVQNCLALGLDSSSSAVDADGLPLTADTAFSRVEDNRSTAVAPDLLSNVGARYRWGTGEVGFRGMLQAGFGDEDSNRGRRMGGGLSAKQSVADDAFWMGGRVSLYDWNDPLRPDRDATSFGYVLAPEYRPADFAKFRVEWEHDMNRLVGQRFRLLGLVSMKVDL
jgi:hypothetical protein